MMVYNDSRHETYIQSLMTPNAADHMYNMDTFFHKAERGELPALTWIGPREGVNKSLGPLGNPNSDHPACCDMALGERLRKDVYEALRAGKVRTPRETSHLHERLCGTSRRPLRSL